MIVKKKKTFDWLSTHLMYHLYMEKHGYVYQYKYFREDQCKWIEFYH